MIINIHDDIIHIRALKLLDKILKDKTTGKNIIWATDAYNFLGSKYSQEDEITASAITGIKVIKTRARKDIEQQNKRAKKHAEIFTPMWLCNRMINDIDENWFGVRDVFNKDGEPTEKVVFPEGKDWKKYVDSTRLEITCGEAPFLMSRYNVETGETVPISRRIGILDRKLRVVNENAIDEEEWKNWALRAYQATYGYEMQGDSLLIARINCLMTYEEYMRERWQHFPEAKDYSKILNVIVWNIWQMDGLKGIVPCTKTEGKGGQLSIFDGEEVEMPAETECYIYDWRSRKKLTYNSMAKDD